MKHQAVLLSLLAVLFLSCSRPEDVTENGVRYEYMGRRVVGSFLCSEGYWIAESNGGGNVTIPSQIAGHPVVGIREEAFQSSQIGKIVLPEGLECIDRAAFSGCEGLTGISLPSSLKAIGERAFFESGLESIDVSEGLEMIGSIAFYGCGHLESIALPASLKKIGDNAFYQSGVRKIVLPSGLEDMGSTVFAECRMLAEVRIDTPLTEIPSYTFQNCSALTDIELPAPLRSIGMSAFAGTGLTRLSCPVGLESIGDSAFKGCGDLKEVSLPPQLSFLGQAAFRGCVSLESIRLPENLTAVPATCFTHCSGLREVSWSDIRSIGPFAFSQCAALTEIDFPESLAEIGDSAFTGCGLAEVELPPGIKTVEERTFAECGQLSEIRFPDGLEIIGPYAFRACSNLRSILLPGGVRRIEKYAFHKCGAVETLKLPPEIKRIGEGAFAECSSIASPVILNNDDLELGTRAFAGCAALPLARLPEGLTAIEAATFQGCASLRDFQFPAGLAHIGRKAFDECANLAESITLSAALESIDADAFEGCVSLKTVNLNMYGAPEIDASAFSGLKNLTVHVPESAEEAFGNPWRNRDVFSFFLADLEYRPVDLSGRSAPVFAASIAPLDLYGEPSVNSLILDSVPYGGELYPLPQWKAKDSRPWKKVYRQGRVGWVCRDLLSSDPLISLDAVSVLEPAGNLSGLWYGISHPFGIDNDFSDNDDSGLMTGSLALLPDGTFNAETWEAASRGRWALSVNTLHLEGEQEFFDDFAESSDSMSPDSQYSDSRINDDCRVSLFEVALSTFDSDIETAVIDGVQGEAPLAVEDGRIRIMELRKNIDGDLSVAYYVFIRGIGDLNL